MCSFRFASAQFRSQRLIRLWYGMPLSSASNELHRFGGSAPRWLIGGDFMSGTMMSDSAMKQGLATLVCFTDRRSVSL